MKGLAVKVKDLYYVTVTLWFPKTDGDCHLCMVRSHLSDDRLTRFLIKSLYETSSISSDASTARSR